MKTYLVIIKEVHERIVRVEALSPKSAMEKVKEGVYKEIMLEPSGETYSHTLDSSLWNVEEDK